MSAKELRASPLEKPEMVKGKKEEIFARCSLRLRSIGTLFARDSFAKGEETRTRRDETFPKLDEGL